MQRKLRTIERIDYRKLHNTGIRQCKEMSSEEKKLAESNNETQLVNSETSESNNDSKLDKSNDESVLKAKLLIDEIDDFIDENPINQYVYSEEITFSIKRITKIIASWCTQIIIDKKIQRKIIQISQICQIIFR